MTRANSVPMCERCANIPWPRRPPGLPTANSATHAPCSVRKRGMHSGEERWKQAAARHREADARLSALKYQERKRMPMIAPTPSPAGCSRIQLPSMRRRREQHCSASCNSQCPLRAQGVNYSTVLISVMMMPNGRSRLGVRHSSAAVDTESKPIQVRKTMAAPVSTPLKPSGLNGCRCYLRQHQ
jgi:hypothetical protein